MNNSQLCKEMHMGAAAVALAVIAAMLAPLSAVQAVLVLPDNSISLQSPNTHAISNVIVYFDSGDGIKRVKFDSFTGEVHQADFDFAETEYAWDAVIGYAVKAGNNKTGPNGEGEYVSVEGARPESWDEFVELEYQDAVDNGVIAPAEGGNGSGGGGVGDGDDGGGDDGDDDGGDGDSEDSDTFMGSVQVSSPNEHDISNVIFYFYCSEVGIVRVKYDSFPDGYDCAVFELPASDYSECSVIGYAVKAGNNAAGPNGEGIYVPVTGDRPDNWDVFVELDSAHAIADGIITDCDGPGVEDDQGKISGQVRLDLDGDGDLSDAEDGRAGIPIELWTDPNNDGDPADGTLVDSKNTDADGNYEFDDLQAGNYVVLEKDPSDDFSSSNDADGGIDEDSWNSIAVELEDGQHVAERDFLDEPFATGTLAFIVNVEALEGSGRRVVEWSTGAESGTVGFLLYGVHPVTRKLVSLSESLLPAAGETSGGIYRVVDPREATEQSNEYIIEEIEDDGSIRRYGPLVATPRDAEAEWLGSKLRPTDKAVPPARRSYTPGSGDFLNLEVAEAGVQYVAAARIAAGLGWTEESARQAIQEARVRLRQQGRPVEYLPTEDGQGFYFYAASFDNAYAGRDVYTLSPGSGGHMGSVEGRAEPGSAASSFVDVLHVEEDKKPIPHAVSDVEEGLWVWTKLLASKGRAGSETFSISVDAPAAEGESILLVHLHGGSEADASPDQQVTVELNNVQIGSAAWDGKVRYSAEFTFDSSLIRDGENRLTLTATLAEGVKHSMTYVDAFDLVFPRQYKARAGQTAFYADGNELISLGGFASDDVQILDVTDPGQPLQVAGITVQATRDGFGLRFSPSSPAAKYVAFTPASATRVENCEPGREVLLSAPTNAADYVIITVDHLAEAVQPLADWRAAEGLETRIVTLQQIANEFGHSGQDPRIIQRFLRTAYQRWAKAPNYALLVGNGTYDYRNVTRGGDNLIPALMTRTEEGLRPADMVLGDVLGNDAVAEIAVGRLPASTPEEVRAMVTKIIGYESAASSAWSLDALLAAGNADAAGNFETDVEALSSAVFADRRIRRIRASEAPEAKRAGLLDALGAGTRLVSYIGHGGFDQLSSGTLLTVEDVPSLGTAEALPVLLAATCHAGNFAEPGRTSLGEALVLQENGGAVAVWAPTGLSFNANSAALIEAFCAAAVQDGALRIGDAVRAATQRWLHEAGPEEYRRDACRTFALIGDPAMKLRINK